MYYFIVNPKASSGAGLKKWNALAALLEKQQISHEVFFTKASGDAVRYARQVTSKGESLTLIAVGGDGTANEVVNGICDFSHTSFGYLPTGSANDLARAFHLPSDPAEALSLLRNPKRVRPVNVGYVHSDNFSRRFLVSFGIGYDAAVCHAALDSKLKQVLNRFHLGKLTYLAIGLKQLVLIQGSPAALSLDSGREISFPSIFFSAFMNTKYEGGGFLFCPDACPDDDMLDVCLVEQLTKRKVLRVLPSAFSGNHTKLPEVHIYRCRKAHIKTPRPLAIHTDGEALSFQNDITVELWKERLNLIS